MMVFCFGNEFVKEDSLARQIADELKIDGIEFVKCESAEEMLRHGKEAVILDVVEGLKDVRLIGLDELQAAGSISSHDFDLGYELKLMKEAGELGDIKIIGIPMHGNKKRIKGQIKKILDIA